MYAEFDDSLVTGNEMIDTQHKELIGKINDLLRSCEDHADRKAAVQMPRSSSRRKSDIPVLRSTKRSTKN